MDEQCAEEERMVNGNSPQERSKIKFCSALYVLLWRNIPWMVSVKFLCKISNWSINLTSQTLWSVWERTYYGQRITLNVKLNSRPVLQNRIRFTKGSEICLWQHFRNTCILIIPTPREGNVFTGICQSFCSQSASWLLGNCSSLLRRGQYASYWNAFLLHRVKTGSHLRFAFATAL